MNNPWMWSALENIGLFTLIGIGIWLTESAWPLLGLYFVRRITTDSKDKVDKSCE